MPGVLPGRLRHCAHDQSATAQCAGHLVEDTRLGQYVLLVGVGRPHHGQETPIGPEELVDVGDVPLREVGITQMVELTRPVPLGPIVHELHERDDQRLAEQNGLRAEIAEDQGLGDLGVIGELTGRRIAITPSG